MGAASSRPGAPRWAAAGARRPCVQGLASGTSDAALHPPTCSPCRRLSRLPCPALPRPACLAQLINTTEVDEWNYPGVMALDSQGRLVVVYGYHLAALDASTGEVLQVSALDREAEGGGQAARHPGGGPCGPPRCCGWPGWKKSARRCTHGLAAAPPPRLPSVGCCPGCAWAPISLTHAFVWPAVCGPVGAAGGPQRQRVQRVGWVGGVGIPAALRCAELC